MVGTSHLSSSGSPDEQESLSSYISALPPRPELDSDVSGQPSRDEIENSPLATIDLSIPRHLGLEKKGGIVKLSDDQNRCPSKGVFLRKKKGSNLLIYSLSR